MSDTGVPARVLPPGGSCRIRIWHRDTGSVETVHTSTERLLEAPNWTDDDRLVVNGDGRLWIMPADGSSEPAPIHAPGLPDVNNDHVLSPLGGTVFASANDWRIWEVPLAGGTPRRVTPYDEAMHFLHGVSPDGQHLAYVRLEPDGDDWWASATIHTVGVDGTGDRAVTTHPGPADGCEWTPDAEWLLFNTEQFSAKPGHSQLARIRPDGGGLEQLTFDERVNWFPHVAPTGDAVAYLSYPPGTEGHPADLPVEIRLVHLDDWRAPTTLVTLRGGQGTINVPSWRPDGGAFAFVDYPAVPEDVSA
ncbi:hypothetical protein DZF95_00210 [Clavibacter michiganensis]|nr:hypothetical protein DZF95_00210 [Clavibacter michiganensis]